MLKRRQSRFVMVHFMLRISGRTSLKKMDKNDGAFNKEFLER